MKNIIITIAAVIFAFTLNAQVNYLNTTTNGANASAIGENNDADGNNAFVGGVNSKAQGQTSFAFGSSAETHATNAVALGLSTKSNGVASFTIGKYITSNGTDSYVIGKGITSSYRLVNDIPNSLMIGMNSTKPTFFVSQSYGLEGTGKIGIGNVTDPQAKLHIKGDSNEYTPEDADLLLEPGSADNVARIMLGTTGNIIDAKDNFNLNFHTASGFVFWDANVGIGTDSPQAKLQITDGDIFIEDIDRGIIMKSPDGQCWRGTLDNSGTLAFAVIDCDLITKTEGPGPEQDFKISVYPNPSKDVIWVKANGKCNRFSVRLKDMNGSTIIVEEMLSGKIKIERKNLSAGNYILEVVSEDGSCVYSEKIILL